MSYICSKKAVAGLSVMLMVSMAFMCIPVFADDSDAASYSYSAISTKKIELSPVPGDVITITDVSSISGCPYAVLNTSTHVATVTIPQMSAGKYVTYDSYIIQNTNGGSCYLELHTSEHWPTGMVENYFYEVTPTVYVGNGTVVSFTATYDDTDNETYYLDYEKVTYVTPGVGLTLNNGSLSGTINAPAGTTIYIDWVTHYEFVDDGITDYSGRITLAVVSPDYTHTVHYSANGGTGSMADTKVTDSSSGSTNVTLASNGFSKAGYDFAGWKIGNVIYQPGQMVSVAANTSVNAVAQWTPIPVNITSSGDDADIVVGNSFSRAITTDVAGTTISFTGPSWLTLSGSTLVGTPSVAGDYTVTVNATNGVSSDSQTFGIHVVNRLAFESVPTGGILATPVI